MMFFTDTELTLSREWGDVNMNEDLMVVQDEELSATSNEEARNVFALWKADDDINELMEIDEEIGANLLDDALFGDEPLSPNGPLEELSFMMKAESTEKFQLPSLGELIPNSPPFTLQPKPSNRQDETYQASVQKLAESMRRSQETRKSLTLKTLKTKTYARSQNVQGVLSSVESSSRQLQQLYLPRNM